MVCSLLVFVLLLLFASFKNNCLMAILQTWRSIFYFISSEKLPGGKNQFLTLENCFNLSVIVKENTEICSVVTHMWMNNEDLKNNSSHSTSIHFSVDVEGLRKKESFIRVMLGIEIFFPVLNILKLARFYYFHLSFLKIYFILKKIYSILVITSVIRCD